MPVPTLTLTSKSPDTVAADALVVAVASSGSAGSGGARLLGGEALPAAVRTALAQALAVVGATGGKDSVQRIPAVAGVAAKSVVFTGLGPVPGAPDAEGLRRAAGAAVRQLAGLGKAVLALPGQLADDADAVTAVAEGALFGAYSYNRYRTGDAAKAPVGALVIASAGGSGVAVRAGIKRAKVLAAAVNGTRDLINAAPVDLFPAAFAAEATKAVEGLPVTVTVLDERRLARGGYGGILAVGQGSSRPPRLVKLEYAPAGAAPHVALVGKGITFDSGGLSIKPAAGMDAMKSDMSGAAGVLHTVAAVARLGLPIKVTGWLAIAENMPSGTAQRPSDVITIRGGRTVEVLNTDAEGRLVLADAIVAAGELHPDVIVDVATLTGAQMVALGNRTSAIMANDDALRERVHRIADAAGEQFWPMPLPPELRASMDSRVADIANIGDRFGGMLVAGLFLQEFVPNRVGDDGSQVPWAHLDIAGPAFNTGPAFGYTPAGGTGVAVRTLVSLCEDLAAAPLA
jgi:leucyl aminopeptidase